ncbi:hypothetical protein Hypma_000346 [Hypsizygus marmoreus]|uniref:Plasmid pRiA4b Orf3-like domain-containing protein n=1 Tax=Hypsizygus marmoreus TaxID=39966 RepID=A0A369JB40_HYPMA|nr:hypothetical protein Hypma_000346 [Hypsizygus marmoreus]
MPWWNAHLHEFTFSAPTTQARTMLSRRNDLLKIGPASLYDEDEEPFDIPGIPPQRHVPHQIESKLLLKDVFDQDGRLRDVVAPNGQLAPLYYLYDFGDNWEHELIFKGSKAARQDRPVFTAATGCAPVEDSGAIPGWERVKAAFSARNPSSGQRSRKDWARQTTAHYSSDTQQDFDPFKDPDLTLLNDKRRWDIHVQESFAGERGQEDNEYSFN